MTETFDDWYFQIPTNLSEEDEKFEKVIEILAKSDAEFDGRTYEGLGRLQKERYKDRSRKGLEKVFAYLKVSW